NKQKANEKEAGKIIRDIMKSNSEAEIVLMQGEFGAKMQEIEDEYEEEMRLIKEKEAKLAELKLGSGGLSEEDKKSFEEARVLAVSKRDVKKDVALKEYLEDALEGILTYEQKRLRIEEEYAKKRKKLYKEGKVESGFVEGVNEGNLANLNKAEEDAMGALNLEYAKKEESFVSWCNRVATYSLGKMKELLEATKRELEVAKSLGADEKDVVRLNAQVVTLQNNIKNIESIPVGRRSIQEWKSLNDIIVESSSVFKGLGETIGGVAGEILSFIGDISSALGKLSNAVVQIGEIGANAMSNIGNSATNMIGKIGAITSMVSSAVSLVGVLINLFNDDKSKEEYIQRLQAEIDTLEWEREHRSYSGAGFGSNVGETLDKLNGAYEKYRRRLQEITSEYTKVGVYYSTKSNFGSSYNPSGLGNSSSYSPFGNIGQQYLNGFGSNSGMFNTAQNQVAHYYTYVTDKTAMAMKKQEAYNDMIKEMVTLYASAEYTYGKSLGEKKYENASKDLKNITEQQLKLRKQIGADEDKKDSDDSKIEEYKKEIEELAIEAAEIVNGMLEDIIGGTAEEIAEKLGDAMFEAFKNGEDYALAWGDAVKDIVGDIVKNMLITKFLEEPIGKLMNKYKEQWFDEQGNFIGADKVIASTPQMVAETQALGDSTGKIFESILTDEMKKLLGFEEEVSDTREASKKGIATASQDSVDELNGRMTAVQGHTYSI
ncbi:MAG TPA: hypothetical protein DDY68_06540, partial [Porphyromonadaceae bacterium]|nr:hypothetical protein [Porphyromonadaceae bacterium]